MSRLFIIIEREYLQRVGKKSFILTTILVPIISLLLCVVLPIMLSSVHNDELKPVAVIDQSPDARYMSMLSDTEDYHFVPLGQADTALHDLYNEGDFYAVAVIPQDVEQSLRLGIYSEQSVPSSLGHDISRALRPALRQQRVASFGIDSLDQIIEACDVDLRVDNVKWDEEGSESESSAELAEILGLLLALGTYMFILMFGSMIMSGVVEEKTSRIVEVIVSSCKPMELMLGKIIGVALVGFTQLVLWGILIGIGGSIAMTVLGVEGAQEAAVMSNPAAALAISQGVDPAALDPMAAQVAEALDPTVAAQPEAHGVEHVLQMIRSIDLPLILICFVLYFIGGYLLYASLFAAFGSAVDQQEDTTQFVGPLMLLLIFALYAGLFSMENPDGPLAWWCSMIPFTSPVTMMIRLPFNVPTWELCLSIGVLFATALTLLWLSGRIYRVGILMYGQKFSWRTILRWVKQ